MVEQQPSKLNTRVRFPSPAPMISMSGQDRSVTMGAPPTPRTACVGVSCGKYFGLERSDRGRLGALRRDRRLRPRAKTAMRIAFNPRGRELCADPLCLGADRVLDLTLDRGRRWTATYFGMITGSSWNLRADIEIRRRRGLVGRGRGDDQAPAWSAVPLPSMAFSSSSSVSRGGSAHIDRV